MATEFQTLAATQEKAFFINMDDSFYGAFAEIGAGQETANWFFRSSGAAGTVAKTISAYDMTVSDTLYGSVQRYVSEERLRQMMDYEYSQLIDRLGEKRGANTCFFSFCNTAKCKGYKDNGPWAAWIGVRFQLKPGAPPSDLIMHVRLIVPDQEVQKRVLGILGVNLLYALFYKRERMEEFVRCVGENLDRSLYEVDLMRFSGNGFSMFDNRILALQLVRSGLSEATLFCPEDNSVQQPSDFLYKRPIVLMRGSFMPLCNIHLEMMDSVRAKFCSGLTPEQREREIDICEISLSNLLRGEEVDLLDFLDRVDALSALRKTVLVTNITHFHRISTLLNQFTKEPVAIALSIGLLHELFKEKWAADLPGGILGSMAHIFLNQTKCYVTPWINRSSGEFVTAGTYRPPEKYRFLYMHLMENGSIVEVPYFNQKLLTRTPRDIVRMINEGDEQWKEYVPEQAHCMAEHLKGGHSS